MKEEVDELGSDYDEEYEDDDGNFRIRDALPLPSATVYSTLQLHSMIHQGYIELNPPYQRDVVWPQEKKIALIESLFRNYYIPPILFLVSEDPDLDGPTRICMDGKQRLTSIQAFFDGQIPYQDPLTRKKFYYTGSTYGKNKLIPEHYKKMFSEKQITCVEYRGISGTVERDIFQRVQMGVTLTAAEKLAAISSPFAEWISNLDTKHILHDHDGLSSIFKWDSKRGKHFQNLAQMILCIESLPNRTQPTSQKLATWLRREDPPVTSLKNEVEQVLNTYWQLASSKELKAPFENHAKYVSPIEFVFIGVLIAVLQGCSLRVISEEIGDMRKYVRDQHKDIRANNQVISTLWDFIELARLRGEQRATIDSSTPVKKRRRGEDDDADYRPTPIRSLGKAPILRVRSGK